MDPVANITEQRELAAEILAHPYRAIADRAARLAELAQALDEWRAQGGFDPYAPSLAGRLHDLTEAAQVVCHADREFRESIPFQPREAAWQVFREKLAGPLNRLRELLPGA